MVLGFIYFVNILSDSRPPNDFGQDTCSTHLSVNCRSKKIRRSAARVGGKHAGRRLRGVLREDTEGHVRGRAHTAVRAVRDHLGPPSDDGPHDGDQPRICLRHVHHP